MYNRELHMPTNASLYSLFDVFNVPTEWYLLVKWQIIVIYKIHFFPVSYDTLEIYYFFPIFFH